MTRRTTFLLIASFLLATTGCSFGPKVWVAKELDLTVAAEKAEVLDVKTHNGQVKVKANSSLSEVKIHIKKEGGGESQEHAQRVLDAIEPFAETAGKTIRVGWKWKNKKRLGHSRVAFTIEAPPELATRLKTHNGRIIVEGMLGSLKAKSHNGGIVASGFEDAVDLETHNGGIKVSDGSTHKVRLDTHNGSITARRTATEPLNGTVSTYNGGIWVGAN